MNTVRSAPPRRNRLLSALSPADLSVVAPHLKEVTLGAREVLHETQEPIEHVYFLHGGMVSLLAMTEDGEAVESAAVGAEGMIGASVGLGIRRALSRAVVQVPGPAARIGATQFQKAVNDNAALRELVMRNTEGLLVQAQQTAACGTLHAVEARLARWLLQAQDRSGSDSIPLIQEFLAQVLGVRRTTINLVVGTMHDANLIRYRRGRIEIVDREGLKAQSCSCYQIVQRQLEQVFPAKD